MNDSLYGHSFPRELTLYTRIQRNWGEFFMWVSTTDMSLQWWLLYLHYWCQREESSSVTQSLRRRQISKKASQLESPNSRQINQIGRNNAVYFVSFFFLYCEVRSVFLSETLSLYCSVLEAVWIYLTPPPLSPWGRVVCMEQCESAAALLESVREQEVQFEQLTRALEEERRRVGLPATSPSALGRPLPHTQVTLPHHPHPETLVTFTTPIIYLSPNPWIIISSIQSSKTPSLWHPAARRSFIPSLPPPLLHQRPASLCLWIFPRLILYLQSPSVSQPSATVSVPACT